MSIPYNDNLCLSTYQSNPDWYQNLPGPSMKRENQVKRAAEELFATAFKQPVLRGVQFIRDAARLVLKVPVRAVATPIFLEKNWQERGWAIVNTKLTSYAFVQLASVPVKFLVALVALLTSAISQASAKRLLDSSERWTAHLDGRASQLEALKEEGIKKAVSYDQHDQYKRWLYSIDAQLCRKSS